MAYLILIGLVVAGLFGVGFKYHAQGVAEGRAACQAELKAADDRLAAKAAELTQETANHIADMATAYDVGESKAKTRTVVVKSKGATDVSKYPVFQNPVCVLPADSLRNVNAARAGLRSDPPADGVRAGSDGPSAGPGPAADPAPPDGAVRGAGAATQGKPRGDVPADAGGRRPLGKMR